MNAWTIALIGGVAYLAFRGGAQAAAGELEAQFEELTWWDKLLLGIGWNDPEDVLDTSALNGVRLGRSKRCTTC